MKKLPFVCFLLIASTSVLTQNKIFQVYPDSTLLRKDNDALILDIENRVKEN